MLVFDEGEGASEGEGECAVAAASQLEVAGGPVAVGTARADRYCLLRRTCVSASSVCRSCAKVLAPRLTLSQCSVCKKVLCAKCRRMGKKKGIDDRYECAHVTADQAAAQVAARAQAPARRLSTQLTSRRGRG